MNKSIDKTQEALRVERALKLALEALEGSQYRMNQYGYQAMETTIAANNKAITAIRAALASKSEALMSVPDGAHAPEVREQPPCKYPHCPYPCPDLPDCRDAEQPASKPWVGLTDEERNAIGRHHAYVDNIIRATEAKLREKNEHREKNA